MRKGQGVGKSQAKMVTDNWGSTHPVEFLDQLSDYHFLETYIQLPSCTYNALGVESHPGCHSYQRRHIRSRLYGLPLCYPKVRAELTIE